MVNTIKTVDYGIDSLWEENGKTNIRIKRIGEMPMPVDVQLTFKDSAKELALYSFKSYVWRKTC